jgi:uncharacterized protein (DUF169 family)
MNDAELSQTLSRLKLACSPVAIAFLNAPPADLSRIGASLPAGCSYWKHASEGHAFYTTAEDHQGCPIGALTHGIELPPDKAQELHSLVGNMIELRYLSSDEIAHFPHRVEAFRIGAYAPLGRATFTPDIVLFRGNTRQIMLLSEAARAAGAFEPGSAMGRPACAMLPRAIDSRRATASIGCIGNRVYTGLGDDELYLTVPGEVLEDMLAQLSGILTANEVLEAFHRDRAASADEASRASVEPRED